MLLRTRASLGLLLLLLLLFTAVNASQETYMSVVTREDVRSNAFVSVFTQRFLLGSMGSKRQHVVVAVGLSEEKDILSAFQNAGFAVREHEDIPSKLGLNVSDTYNSIAAWGQIGISKAVLLDKNVLIRSNLDNLFAEKPFTGAYDYPPLEMNAAVLVIAPDKDVYQRMLEFVGKPLSNTGDGCFQGFLNAFTRERHFLPPFTVGDMRYSLLGNSWGDDQVRSGIDTRYKPAITRAFAFVDPQGRPLRTPWSAVPFGAFSQDLLTDFKREFASATAMALAEWPRFRTMMLQRVPWLLDELEHGAFPFRPIDHRARSEPGCQPTRTVPWANPQHYAYASVMVGTRDVNALLMQHMLLTWTNTTIPHIVVAVGLPRREIDRIKAAGMHPIVFHKTPYVDRHAGFNKLFLFNLTQYTKIVFLDADAWPLHNVDFMFNYPGLAGAPDNFIVNEFNTGVLVVEPHGGLYTHLNHMYELYIRGSIGWGTDGTDQGFLNTVCAAWVPLPFTLNYRFFRNFTDPLFHDARELFYLQHRLADIAIVHTYTFTKPYLLESWRLTDASDPDAPPDMSYEYPEVFRPIVRRLWRAWVLSRQAWGHRKDAAPSTETSAP